ncbi:MAG: pectate lyase [Alphaproteobacteria bacterium]|nr:MAG: pectate lyase [Alphaproteobacteria bacterium]PZO37986.1 MAG: pectate lyase [Alphaproteobacteria bacterium]
MPRSLNMVMATMVIAWSSPAFAQTPVVWNTAIIERDLAWFGSAEARSIADTVILHQSPEGGWPKNTSLIVSPDDAPVDPASKNTFDNEATTLPLAFLARVIAANNRPADRAAFDRGLDYTLMAELPNGGWPQFYPLRSGYYSHITFNDDAMVRILTLLRDVSAGVEPYGFVDDARRARAGEAVARGVKVILATQVRRDGVLTVWCAQHDAVSLQPAWARAYEPPSLSGNESVGITRFLMSIPEPSDDVIAAVEGAVRWFETVQVAGQRLQRFTGPDGRPDVRVIADAEAQPLWARFYDLQSDRPIFLGRDSLVQPEFSMIERERRTGYNYYGTWPQSLLSRDYPAWRQRVRSNPS